MAKIIIKCPYCGEETQVDDSRESAYCSCCGKKLDVKEILHPVLEETPNNVEDKDISPVIKESDNNKQESAEDVEKKQYAKIGLIIVGIVVFLLVILSISNSHDNNKVDISDTSFADSDSIAAPVDDAPEQALPSTKKTWEFSSKTNEMTDSKDIWASLTSDNTIEQDFPYSTTSGVITIRHMKKYGYDVLISITSGQIHGNEYDDDNYVMARFGNNKPIKYWFDEPADNSSDVVFIRKASDFIRRCKKAKAIKVEIPIYQGGRPIFEFSVDEPLKWTE